MKILVSSCLLGLPCRYDGKSKSHPAIVKLSETETLIPFCPEIYGGLPTPRPPAEIQGERVMNAEHTDVTAQYRKGAEEALRLCKMLGCEKAILKANSPSCGCGAIYDGTFTKTLVPGNGITAALLLKEGIKVRTENDL